MKLEPSSRFRRHRRPHRPHRRRPHRSLVVAIIVSPNEPTDLLNEPTDLHSDWSEGERAYENRLPIG